MTKIRWSHGIHSWTGRYDIPAVSTVPIGRFVLEQYKTGYDLYRVLFVKYVSPEEDEYVSLSDSHLFPFVQAQQMCEDYLKV